MRSDILVLAIFSRRRRIGAPSGSIKGAITLESGKTKRAAARGASRGARGKEKREEKGREKAERAVRVA